MRRLTRVLPLRTACHGWAHALLGALAGMSATAVATAVLALAWPHTPAPVFALAALAAVALLGVPRAGRSVSVRTANALLRTALPRPETPRRFATAVWAVAWTLWGGALMTATLLAGVALVLPLVWLTGGGGVTIVVDARVSGGSDGAWTLLVAVLGVVALVAASAGGARLLGRLAVALLGPSLAERLAAAEVEADRAAVRNRIARDLHDSIGHALTSFTFQAAVANQVFESDPDAARRAMSSIEGGSRAALDDLDRALGVLREEPEPATARPTLADLAELVGRVVQGGNEVDVAIDGDLDAVTAAVSREAYRIVQEGLTNALRHAPGARVELKVTVYGSELILHVGNEIAAASQEGGRGRGLIGATERVRLLGGTALAGPEGPNRWVLRATLPLKVSQSEADRDRDAGSRPRR
ncbi:histidine kinase [Glycomyces sp. A-F 0318]|uniref:sensor histidine kinase n=1 Tax=Glycomyces amatae TaxID=2881355 RepID=UPI001E3EA4D3|nr:histidine kinase [Glycomyces amatae]MCD0447527.1 histidine kinase [Glycomyces amatae]